MNRFRTPVLALLLSATGILAGCASESDMTMLNERVLQLSSDVTTLSQKVEELAAGDRAAVAQARQAAEQARLAAEEAARNSAKADQIFRSSLRK